jgi:hypothetical protein
MLSDRIRMTVLMVVSVADAGHNITSVRQINAKLYTYAYGNGNGNGAREKSFPQESRKKAYYILDKYI